MVIMNSIALKVLFGAAVLQVINSEQLDYIQDGDFMSMKRSNNAFAVFLHDKKSLNDEMASAFASIINQAVKDYEDPSLKFGMIDCQVSTIGGCMRKESFNHVLLYKERDIVAELSAEDLQTPMKVRAIFSHYLNVEGIIHVDDQEGYLTLQKEFLGKQDIVIFYISDIGTQEHLDMIEHAHSLPEDIVIAFTTNEELRSNDDIVWYLSCAKAQANRCEIGLSTSDFKSETWKQLLSKLTPITYFQSDASEFHEIWKKMVKNNVNTLLLIAGRGRSEDVKKLAKDFVDIAEDTHCLVVDISQNLGSVTNFVNQRVQDNEIFATIIAKDPIGPVDLGYLESEDAKFLLELFMEALATIKTEEIEVESQTEVEIPAEYTNPSEFQDDPVAFSVYEQKKVRDLYYFDFKTIPRLTDKTYAELMKSNNYSVILFTLELEARAIAVLMDFVDIHKSYEDGHSPLYRVECYHWPDVCKLAGVVSTPRMFFFPANTDKRIEYQGIWDQKHMRNAITRFSKPLVIFAEKESDITQNLPMEGKSIIGMFETDEVLSSAISDMSEQYYFVIARQSAAEYLSQKWRVSYKEGKLLALENWKLVKESRVLSTNDAAKSFIENAFDNESQMQELTVYNYINALADEKPLLILFDEKMGEIPARKTIEKLASSEKFSEKISFHWMNSAINTTGEFVLHKYNEKSKLEKPVLAFFNKQGSVVLKSCSSATCTQETVSEWLLACMEGNVDPTYIMSQEPWTPRLEGYNFLEMMKDEGTYPTPKTMSSMKKSEPSDDNDITTVKGGRKGNLEIITKQQQKAMNTMKIEASKESLANAATDMKKAIHNEL